MGKGSTSPAIKRLALEATLIEEFHWLPQDVKAIPYKALQEFFIIRRQRTETAHQKQELEAQAKASKERGSSGGRGQTKRKIQVTQLTP